MIRRSFRSPSQVGVVDLETSGLRLRSCVREVAVVESDRGVVVRAWSAAIAPGDDDALREALDALRGFIGERTTVMHNAGFDLRVLSMHAQRLGCASPIRAARCTRAMAQRVIPGLSAFDLQTVARAVGIEERVQHTALADAALTANVYERLRLLAHPAQE